jgi:branched-chain amino acid transport system substrate-binding protein
VPLRRLALFTVALALVASVAPPPAPAAEPYAIPVILSLTGRFASLGEAEQIALKALEPVVNKRGGIHGRDVQFAIQDDQSQPEVAVQLANAAIARHVPVLLGPTGSTSCAAIAPLMRNGPVDYCFAPTIHPDAGAYVFSSGASSRDQAIEALVFAAGKKWHRLAAISTTDVTGADNIEQFTEAAKAHPEISVVDSERYNTADTSVSAQLARIRTSNPDAILVLAVGPPTGTVLRGLRDAGLDGIPVVSILGNLTRGEMQQYAAVWPPEIYFTAPRFYARSVARSGPVRDAQDVFYKALATQGVPDVGNNLAWDPAVIVVDELAKLPDTADAKALRDAILGLHGFAGTNGIFDFRNGDQRGQQINTLVMVRWNPKIAGVVTVSEPGGKPLR